jgi:hypothetical protein
MRIFLLIAALALSLVAGCLVASTTEEYRWEAKAPARVSMDGRLHFTVEARTPEGTPVMDAPYVWRVEWVGVQGIRHQGRSSVPERILVKGEPGKAVLQILAFDRHHQLVEVARATFEVMPGQLPAD